MDTKQILDVSKFQLTSLLSFFPRIDTRATVLLGIDLALISFSVLKIKGAQFDLVSLAFPLLTTIILSVSLFFLYRCAFPDVKGGEGSLIFFRSVAARSENNFISEFKKAKSSEYVDDLLAQIWRNSCILEKKYFYLKISLILTLVSVIPALFVLLFCGVSG